MAGDASLGTVTHVIVVRINTTNMKDLSSQGKKSGIIIYYFPLKDALFALSSSVGELW